MSLKKGSCHCGAVGFEAETDGIFHDIRRCDCSLCSRKGIIMFSVPLDKFKVVKGEDNLSLYTWNTKTAKHYFCKTCGIYTHHRRRSNPNEYGVNLACMHGVDIGKLEDVPWGRGSQATLETKALT